VLFPSVVGLGALGPGQGIDRVFAQRLWAAPSILRIAGVEIHDLLGLEVSAVSLDRELDPTVVEGGLYEGKPVNVPLASNVTLDFDGRPPRRRAAWHTGYNTGNN
jgi:hypothetical protein